MRKLSTLVACAVVVSVATLSACGSGDEAYKPAPAWSGRKPNLPAPPQLPNTPIKAGDAYTIFGASHHLKSRIHSTEVTAKDITIQGYIVDSNIPNAPACAIHKTGKGDDEKCKTEIPSIWLADTKGEAKAKMRVIGFARNFPVIFDAMEKYKNLKDPPKELVKDDQWQVDVPFPLPAVGAKVKITGKYGYSSTKASGLVTDPMYGVLTYGKIEYLEPSTEPAKFLNKK
jgi:hypothetical protein